MPVSHVAAPGRHTISRQYEYFESARAATYSYRQQAAHYLLIGDIVSRRDNNGHIDDGLHMIREIIIYLVTFLHDGE